MRERISINKIVSLLLIVTLLSFLIVVYLWERQDGQRQDQMQQEYVEKSRLYQSEMGKLQEELLELDVAEAYYGESAHIMVSFSVKGAADITFVRAQAARLEFDPILVIDIAMEPEVLAEVLDVADPTWELMLRSITPDAEDAEKIDTLRAVAESRGRSFSDVAVYRLEQLNQQERELVQGFGFTGVTVYHDSPISGQTEDGMVYFDFSSVARDDIALESRLSQCCEKEASMIYIFDMESMRVGRMNEQQVVRYLDQIFRYVAGGKCSIASVEETVSMLSENNQITAIREMMVEEQREIIRRRIKELEEILQNIYYECFTNADS